MYVYVNTCMYMYVCMYVCMYVRTYVGTYVCMYVSIDTHTHTHTHTHTTHTHTHTHTHIYMYTIFISHILHKTNKRTFINGSRTVHLIQVPLHTYDRKEVNLPYWSTR